MDGIPPNELYLISLGTKLHNPLESFKLLQNAATHQLHKNGCHEYIPTSLCLLFLTYLGGNWIHSWLCYLSIWIKNTEGIYWYFSVGKYSTCLAYTWLRYLFRCPTSVIQLQGDKPTDTIGAFNTEHCKVKPVSFIPQKPQKSLRKLYKGRRKDKLKDIYSWNFSNLHTYSLMQGLSTGRVEIEQLSAKK